MPIPRWQDFRFSCLHLQNPTVSHTASLFLLPESVLCVSLVMCQPWRTQRSSFPSTVFWHVNIRHWLLLGQILSLTIFGKFEPDLSHLWSCGLRSFILISSRLTFQNGRFLLILYYFMFFCLSICQLVSLFKLFVNIYVCEKVCNLICLIFLRAQLLDIMF